MLVVKLFEVLWPISYPKLDAGSKRNSAMPQTYFRSWCYDDHNRANTVVKGTYPQ